MRNPCLFPIQLKDGRFVPCGRCHRCRRKYANQWITRLIHEADNYSNNVHITLTYNDKNYPNSEEQAVRDMQLYIKRVRRAYEYKEGRQRKIRYYLVIERGPSTGRLHSHCILFNTNTYDVRKYLASCWQAGFIYCKSLKTRQMTAYVTNYVGTKQCVKKLMSAGIGKNYLNAETVQYHRAGDIHYVVLPHTSGVKRALPRYYRDKIWTHEERIRQRIEQLWTDKPAEMHYLYMKIRQLALQSRQRVNNEEKMTFFARKQLNYIL